MRALSISVHLRIVLLAAFVLGATIVISDVMGLTKTICRNTVKATDTISELLRKTIQVMIDQLPDSLLRTVLYRR